MSEAGVTHISGVDWRDVGFIVPLNDIQSQEIVQLIEGIGCRTEACDGYGVIVEPGRFL